MPNPRNRSAAPARPRSAASMRQACPPWEMEPLQAQGRYMDDAFCGLGRPVGPGWRLLAPPVEPRKSHVPSESPAHSKKHPFSLPAIAELQGVLRPYIQGMKAHKAGDAPVDPPDVAACVASVAQLHAQFDAYEAPFGQRPHDMHWPAALDSAALVLTAEDTKKQLQGWLDALRKIRHRMSGFLGREEALSSVAQGLSDANGLSQEERQRAHCKDDLIKMVAEKGTASVMVKNAEQLHALLPYLLHAHPVEDLTFDSWVTVANGLANPAGEPGTLSRFVSRMHINTPEHIKALLTHAMKNEREARKRAAKALIVPSAVGVQAQADLRSMAAY
jgi:hypothetical protein